MKKFLVSLAVSLSLIFAPMASSLAIEPVKPSKEQVISNHLFVTQFYDSDYLDLMIQTQNLKKGDTLKLTIMSGGGAAVVAIAMVDLIEELKAKGVHVVTEVAGMSLSAAALLWMTGNERIISSSDMMMFHTCVDNYGRSVNKVKRGKTEVYVMEWFNYLMRQYLLNVLHDTELVNKLLADPGKQDEEYNMNWFTGEEVWELGLATKFIKTL